MFYFSFFLALKIISFQNQIKEFFKNLITLKSVLESVELEADSGSTCPKLVSLLDLQEPGDAGNYHTTTLLQNKAEFLVMGQLVPCL